jgi:hypothetical protein
LLDEADLGGKKDRREERRGGDKRGSTSTRYRSLPFKQTQSVCVEFSSKGRTRHIFLMVDSDESTGPSSWLSLVLEGILQKKRAPDQTLYVNSTIKNSRFWKSDVEKTLTREDEGEFYSRPRTHVHAIRSVHVFARPHSSHSVTVKITSIQGSGRLAFCSATHSHPRSFTPSVPHKVALGFQDQSTHTRRQLIFAHPKLTHRSVAFRFIQL